MKSWNSYLKKYLDSIRQQADSDFRLLNSIQKFDLANKQNPKLQRENLLNKLQETYDPAFERLHPLISYAVRKSTDFSRLEREARQ